MGQQQHDTLGAIHGLRNAIDLLGRKNLTDAQRQDLAALARRQCDALERLARQHADA